MSAITKSDRVEKLMLRSKRGVTQKELFKLTGWRHTNMRVAQAARASVLFCFSHRS